MSQCDDISDHLQNKGSITPVEALDLYGCFRLAARIKELREDGFPIMREMVWKNGKSFARYYLTEDGKAA